MNIDRRRMRRVVATAFAATLLAAATGTVAQAPTNPNLNAQLLVGARQGDLAQVERVLAAGAVPSSRNRLGKTALLLAAEKGNLAIVEALLAGDRRSAVKAMSEHIMSGSRYWCRTLPEAKTAAPRANGRIDSEEIIPR